MKTRKGRKSNLDEFNPKLTTSPDDYIPYIGKKRVENLKDLAGPLEGKEWSNINSTLLGGGVAEILSSLVPLARGLGLKAHWYALNGNHIFFQTTKKFHNMLQGLDLPLTMEEMFGSYLDTVEENARNCSIGSDMIVVHDPQPLALMAHGVLFGNVIWRCHIDTSKPNKTLWRFLLPYINQYAGAVFTMPEFVGPGLQLPLYEISPCIDPHAPKNKQYSKEEALEILEPLFKEFEVDADRPILAAISRYDIHKNQESILTAFNKLRRETNLKKPPYLILMGNTAADDPEGDAVLEMLKNKAGEDPDVKFWVNVKNNDIVVGALMSLAKGFIHVSTKEGFGLVVSEALWQGTPVIGSRVGGIIKQVEDGKDGFLVEPHDVDSIAKNMEWILENETEAEKLGQHGQDLVRKHFLLPALAEKYLTVMQHVMKLNKQIPSFRMNELTYNEVMDTIRNQGLTQISEAQRSSQVYRKKADINLKIA